MMHDLNRFGLAVLLMTGTLSGSVAAQGNTPFDLGNLVLSAGGGFDPLEEERTIESFSSEDIERSNIKDVQGALERTANVLVTSNTDPLSFRVTVRGLSDLGNVNTTGPTVGFFQDGVLLNQVGQSSNFNSQLVDVERVDVFLGPQTTSFSKGTTAGAVNVVTKKPTEEVAFSVEGDLGFFDAGSAISRSGSVVANVPLLDDGLLTSRLVLFRNASDGFVRVFQSDFTDRLDNEVQGGRLSLRSKPNEQLTFDVQLSYIRTEYAGSNEANIALVEAGEYVSFFDPAGRARADDISLRFEAQYDTDIGVFRSNTAYRRSDATDGFDIDNNPTIDFTRGGVNVRTTSFSQEFRYEGTAVQVASLPGEVTFNGGVSFGYNEFFASDTAVFGPDAPFPDPPSFGRLFTDDVQEAYSIGVYGDAAWRPVPQLELTGGLRYSWDHIESSDVTVTTGQAGALGLFQGFPRIDGEATFGRVVPRAAVSYDWSDTLTTFGAYTVGYRPGGTSEVGSAAAAGITNNLLIFDEEITRSFELGVRSRVLNDNMMVSASLFYTQIEDFQVPVSQDFGPNVPPQVALINLGDAESYGAELSVAATPLTGLLLQGQMGVNFTEITDYRPPALPGPGGGFLQNVDLTGQDLPNAPDFTFSLTGEYEHPKAVIGDLRPFIRVDYTFLTDYLSGFSGNQTTITRNPIDGYQTVDLRVGLRGERFNIELFAENLFNERYVTTSRPAPVPFGVTGFPAVAGGAVGTPGPPLRVGIRGQLDF